MEHPQKVEVIKGKKHATIIVDCVEDLENFKKDHPNIYDVIHVQTGIYMKDEEFTKVECACANDPDIVFEHRQYINPRESTSNPRESTSNPQKKP